LLEKKLKFELCPSIQCNIILLHKLLEVWPTNLHIKMRGSALDCWIVNNHNVGVGGELIDKSGEMTVLDFHAVHNHQEKKIISKLRICQHKK